MRVFVVIAFLLSSFWVSAKDYSEKVIEADLNSLFRFSLSGAASQLDARREVTPFASVIKSDGRVGFLYLPEDNEEVKNMSLNDQASYLRAQLRKTALNGEIRSSALTMYTILEVEGVRLQGLSIELEHASEIAMYRFVPVSNDQEEDTLTIHTENIVTEENELSIFIHNL